MYDQRKQSNFHFPNVLTKKSYNVNKLNAYGNQTPGFNRWHGDNEQFKLVAERTQELIYKLNARISSL